MSDATEKRVEPYPDPVRDPEELVLKTYEYHHPFNYTNIEVFRRYLKSAQEFHGLEMNPVNSVAADKDHHPPDTITITQHDPIVRVAVMGSACQPNGFVQLEAEPLDELYRPDHVPDTSACRFRIGNLWGMHLRGDQWLSKSDSDVRNSSGEPYPEIPEEKLEVHPFLKGFKIKASYREHPQVGMSCAIFEIPKSSKVIISGGTDAYGWQEDNFPEDVHYSFRVIRVTVAADERRARNDPQAVEKTTS